MTAAALTAALLHLAPGPTHAARVELAAPLIADVADRCGAPPALLAAVAWEESSLRPRARSRRGALGLTGLMPTTVAEMLGRRVTREELLEPATNLALGCAYLQHLRRGHGWRYALFRYDGAKPASHRYVRDVMATWRRLEAWAGSEQEVAAR